MIDLKAKANIIFWSDELKIILVCIHPLR